MHLSKNTVEEFQEIYKEEYGINISYEEAETQALRVLRLFSLIYKPIKNYEK